MGRPHSKHSVPAHPAGMATPRKAHFPDGQGILGLQRWTEPGQWLPTERPQNCHPRVPLRGVPSKATPWPSVSHESSTECQATPVLAQAGCRHHRLHKKVPGMYQAVTPSQRTTASSRCARTALGTHCHGLLLCQWQLYILICDYFSKFPFLFQMKSTSWANLKDHLTELFAIEGTPDEIMSDNGPPFNGKEFSDFLSGLGIRHSTSSPNYPQSNGFIERQIQTVKHLMEKATASGRSFQEALTGLRAQPLGDGLPSPAEILHGRSLTTRKATPVDIKAVRDSSNCFAGQVHQGTWQGMPGKSTETAGDWGRSLLLVK